MITIKDIEISRFRSIREAKLADLHDFSVLAGLNNSGKSNFLRALNAYSGDVGPSFRRMAGQDSG